MAKLYFRYGAMNCGKTTALLQTAHNYSESGQKAIIIKPAVDTKMKACVTSRLGIKREVDLLVNEELDLFEYFKELIKNSGLKVESGIFGADMKVELLNNGPVTIVMDSKTKS